MKHIEVVAAIIKKEDKILATQRGYGEFKGLWEFPGGKIENNESKEAALIREIKEELKADITMSCFVRTIEFDYPTFHLTMHCYFAKLKNNSFQLTEHMNACWLTKDKLNTVDWLPADIEIVEELKKIPFTK